MIVLGLGSNIGDRLSHLRHALIALKKTPGLTIQQVSPVYISDALLPENAPADWNMSYLNAAVRCETTLEPDELLIVLKKIESNFGRQIHTRHWGPREIDIDILIWDDRVIHTEALTIPKTGLRERPFALWPLADVVPLSEESWEESCEQWGSRFSGTAPLHTRQIAHRIDTSQLVGIINATPDSFSDGGECLDPEKALQRALQLSQAGADVIDIGAESTSPHAHAIDAETEWQRLKPILNAIQSNKHQFLLPPKISVDTRHASVAEKALALGVDWINDVTGLTDPAMRSVIANAKVDCVVMHHIRIPEDRNFVIPRNQNPVDVVYEWGARRLDLLEQSNISRDKIIFDPGIGFGKMAEHSLLLIKHIDRFKQLGTRLLVGHSRKTFLALFTANTFADRDIETLAVSLFLAKQDVDYLRVHNVEMSAQGLKVASILLCV